MPLVGKVQTRGAMEGARVKILYVISSLVEIILMATIAYLLYDLFLRGHTSY